MDAETDKQTLSQRGPCRDKEVMHTHTHTSINMLTYTFMQDKPGEGLAGCLVFLSKSMRVVEVSNRLGQLGSVDDGPNDAALVNCTAYVSIR